MTLIFLKVTFIYCTVPYFGFNLMFPHDYIQVMHSWLENHIRDVFSLGHHIWRHMVSTCPSLMMLILIAWSKVLPNFFSAYLLFFLLQLINNLCSDTLRL